MSQTANQEGIPQLTPLTGVRFFAFVEGGAAQRLRRLVPRPIFFASVRRCSA